MTDHIGRVNIQTKESMLKHCRDLPNLTCGTTIAPPRAVQATGTANATHGPCETEGPGPRAPA